MRAAIAILGALVLLAGAGAGVVAAAAGAQHHPRLTLADANPVSVRGHDFHRRERVRVVLRSAGTKVVRHVRATRRGRFTATFPPDAARPCRRFSVTAWGARSGRVPLLYVMQPDCAVE